MTVDTAVKERPILFSAPMVRAILADQKTQTRRIVKPQPILDENDRWYWRSGKKEARWDNGINPILMPLLHAPHGKPGDRLWVRETCAFDIDALKGTQSTLRQAQQGGVHVLSYKADDYWRDRASTSTWKWTPGIHMPRWASRISRDMTDVRVHRLQEISADDCIAEGVSATEFWTPKELESRPFEEKWWDDYHFWNHYPQIVMRRLWESINGPRSWDANPWVWAYTFKQLAESPEKPEGDK